MRKNNVATREVIEALERGLREVGAGLLAFVTINPPPLERAFASIRQTDEEDLSDAERRAALIRERMRRDGFLR